MRIDSMNIQVREPPPVGEGKSVCGHCHHRGHQNQALKPCSLKKCTEYIYCGIKEKHPEFFSELNSLKLQRKKRKDAVGHLESQLQSMEQFSTNSEHQFAKNLAPGMFNVDESYKKNKPKLIRDVRLLRESLYGKIPPGTTNDAEQLRIWIARCKRSKQLHADDSPQTSVSGRSEEFSLVKITSRDNEVNSPSPAEKGKGYHETPVKRSLERIV